MNVINFSEARNNLKSVLDQVVNDIDYTIISRRNSENAVVMSLETFNKSKNNSDDFQVKVIIQNILIKKLKSLSIRP